MAIFILGEIMVIWLFFIFLEMLTPSKRLRLAVGYEFFLDSDSIRLPDKNFQKHGFVF